MGQFGTVESGIRDKKLISSPGTTCNFSCFKIFTASSIHFFLPLYLGSSLLYLQSDKTKIETSQTSNRQGPALIPSFIAILVLPRDMRELELCLLSSLNLPLTHHQYLSILEGKEK